MIQLIIIKENNGYDVSEMWSEIVWSGRKSAAARSIKITMIDDDSSSQPRIDIDPAEGHQCVMYDDDIELFRGLITNKSQNDDKTIIITAYDNAIYLANNKDSFSFTNKTASQIFSECMNRIGMTGGDISETTYVIPELVKSKTTYYDTLLDALSTTYKATGSRYYIYSEQGNIHLAKRSENMVQWVLQSDDNNGNITSYDYSKSISDIKTRVRLLSSENTVVYEQINSELEAKIGTFMEIESADDDYTQAQIQELVQSLLDEYSTPEQTLKISVIGNNDVIAGKAVYICIPHLDISRTFYVDADTHTFTRYKHIMTLTLNFANDIETAG